MSVKSDPESGSTRSEDGSEADSEDSSSFTLVEIPHTDTTTFCKLCFRKAQVITLFQPLIFMSLK